MSRRMSDGIPKKPRYVSFLACAQMVRTQTTGGRSLEDIAAVLRALKTVTRDSYAMVVVRTSHRNFMRGSDNRLGMGLPRPDCIGTGLQFNCPLHMAGSP